MELRPGQIRLNGQVVGDPASPQQPQLPGGAGWPGIPQKRRAGCWLISCCAIIPTAFVALSVIGLIASFTFSGSSHTVWEDWDPSDGEFVNLEADGNSGQPITVRWRDANGTQQTLVVEGNQLPWHQRIEIPADRELTTKIRVSAEHGTVSCAIFTADPESKVAQEDSTKVTCKLKLTGPGG
jgi:hypothetical protein